MHACWTSRTSDAYSWEATTAVDSSCSVKPTSGACTASGGDVSVLARARHSRGICQQTLLGVSRDLLGGGLRAWLFILAGPCSWSARVRPGKWRVSNRWGRVWLL